MTSERVERNVLVYSCVFENVKPHCINDIRAYWHKTNNEDLVLKSTLQYLGLIAIYYNLTHKNYGKTTKQELRWRRLWWTFCVNEMFLSITSKVDMIHLELAKTSSHRANVANNKQFNISFISCYDLWANVGQLACF